MKHLNYFFFLLTTVLLAPVSLRANDGVFYAQGNQLIPVSETEISVRKEVLTIDRVGDHLAVTVHYEFFNPSKQEKELIVGFEAASAYPYEGMESFPEHPHMRNFKVFVNGTPLTYQIAHVQGQEYDPESGELIQQPYYVNGKFNGWTRQQCEKAIVEGGEIDYPFDYVYHFTARFRPGVNIVRHTYEYDLSMSVETQWHFPYVLTAANRWANGQIDDFTLRLNMGDRESFLLLQSFFDRADEWTVDGVGKYEMVPYYGGFEDEPESQPMFHMREGGISFHRLNFHPTDELYLLKPNPYWDVWNYDSAIKGSDILSTNREMYVNWDVLMGEKLDFTAAEKRVMRNLPFAARGYVFKSKELQDYFESTAWYIPDPNYVADMEALTEKEKKWVRFWMN